MKKDMKNKKDMKGMSCGDCNVCKTCGWIYAIVIAALALVPSWYGTTWAKWVLVVIAVLMLLGKKCPCKSCK